MNYQKIYNSLVGNRRCNLVEGYSERHHILPRCLGGTEERKKDRKGKQVPWNKGVTGYSTSKKGQTLSDESIKKRTETRRQNKGGKY